MLRYGAMTETWIRFKSMFEVDPDSDCWYWKRALSSSGYGQFHLNGKMRQAHRVAYELLVGPIPAEHELDHLCEVKECVNPDHLEPVTKQENIKRGNTGINQTSKTHCPEGHPYNLTNTYRPPGRPRRMCRTCMRESDRKRRDLL